MKSVLSWYFILLALPLLALSPSQTGVAKVYLNAPPKANGMDTAFVALVESAQSTVDAAFFSIKVPLLVDALIKAKDKGVQVRVVSESDSANDPMGKPSFKKLEEAGIPVVTDHKKSLLMHDKFCVIDKKTVWTGTPNLSFSMYNDGNDVVVFESVPMAAAFTTEFEEMFVEKKFGKAKKNNTQHDFTIDGRHVECYFSPTDSVRKHILQRLSQAKHSIYFAMFSFTDMQIANAILMKWKGGLKVQGIFDLKSMLSNPKIFNLMKNTGMDVRKDPFQGLLHHKFVVIDPGTADAVVVMGSYNFSKAAEDSNDETSIIIHDPLVADPYVARFQEIYKKSWK